VPLLEQLTGASGATICISPDRADIDDKEGWFWDTHVESDDTSAHVKCVSCWLGPNPPCSPSFKSDSQLRHLSPSKFEKTVAKGARDLLKITPVARNSFPMIHEGFQDAYIQIRKQIFDLLIPVLQRQLAKASIPSAVTVASAEPLALPKIYCTGHSLGGSLAQIFALDFSSNCEFGLQARSPNTFGPNEHVEQDNLFFAPSNSLAAHKETKVRRLQPPIAVYTFGQPRVGNKAFSKLYKQRVPHTFRVVNEGDAITAVPNYLCCGGLYKHAGLEVILDEGKTGNILVGPTVVETLFRFSKVRTNITAHQLARYRDCLECAFDESQLLDYYKGHNVAHQDLKEEEKIGENGQSSNDEAYVKRLSSSKFAKESLIPEWMIAPRKSA
jgi:hypothetical protein